MLRPVHLEPLDRTKPLSDQIVLQYVERIERGELAEGTRMPSVRALALSLGVNRNTVAQVYKELAQKGYLVSRFGAGSTVRRPGASPARPAAPVVPLAPEPAPRRLTALEWARRFAGPRPGISLEAPPATAGSEPPINLFHLHPHTGQFPLDAFRLCLNAVLRRSGAELLNYGSPAGYLPLRERIAARLKAQGVAAEPSRILITSGSQQGIDLLVRTFVNPGDSVVVEAPMYSIALKLFQMAGARLQPYPVTAQGVQLEALGEPGAQAPKLAYAVPNFQNPTTHCYTLAERQELLRWVNRSGALLIEDASDAELHPDWPRIVPLAALDTGERVLHLNTLSKTLAPAVRVGYLAGAAPVLHKLTELKEMTDLSHSLILQAATVEFMDRGLFDEHILRVREFYCRRMATVLEMLARHLPREVSFSQPVGGLCVWVDLPAHVDTLRLYEELARQGVLLSPGALYQPVAATRNGVRLCVSQETEPRLEQGIRLLGRALERLLLQRPPAQSPGEYQSIH